MINGRGLFCFAYPLSLLPVPLSPSFAKPEKRVSKRFLPPSFFLSLPLPDSFIQKMTQQQVHYPLMIPKKEA